jgi:formate C-acetyltransferase
MSTVAVQHITSFAERMQALRRTRLAQTAEKQRVIGSMDHDDWALVLPPLELRNVVSTISASGVEIRDCLLSTFTPEANHPSGGFFGPVAVGRNFRRLLEAHPAYVDPMSSLAGAYMTNFFSYRRPHWNPDIPFGFLAADHAKYGIIHGIGGAQHFCQDFTIGLELGWGGIREKIDTYRAVNREQKAQELYEGLESVVLGIQDWIGRTAAVAETVASTEPRGDLREDLFVTARINRRIRTEPPETFREACQWILWHLLVARMYDGSGSVGRLDDVLLPFYKRDHAAGILSDEEAVFHVACILVRDTGYIQLGGYDQDGRDNTNPVSHFILEAIDRLKLTANAGVAVGVGIDPRLLRKGVEMILRNRNGNPKFLGFDVTSRGFARNGHPLPLGWNRVYAGCHWSAIPGREYTLNDIVKINLGVVFDVALHDMMDERSGEAGTDLLWEYFEKHLRRAVSATARGIDFHMSHMADVFPELALDLLCHGTIEKGRDVAAGGVEYYDLGIDATALATVADSFGALEQRIEREKKLGWSELMRFLDYNWSGPDGEERRLLMKNSGRFGRGDSLSDTWAKRIADLFTRLVVEKSELGSWRLIPGIFSWALVFAMGQELGATPNGRRAGEPISHGANPHPGFRKDGAATAIAAAVAGVQPGYGNAAPLQLDIDPSAIHGSDATAIVESLIRTHFAMGGTQVNLNVLDVKDVLEALDDPSRHPELVVRVTGFSAYFSSLSPAMRRFVVDRIISEGKAS